jgi:hypothetical protein
MFSCDPGQASDVGGSTLAWAGASPSPLDACHSPGRAPPSVEGHGFSCTRPQETSMVAEPAEASIPSLPEEDFSELEEIDVMS